MNFKQCHKLKEITAPSIAHSITTCLPVQEKINRKEYNNSVLLGCDKVLYVDIQVSGEYCHLQDE